MNTILLISVIAGVSLQSIFKKAFNNKINGGAFIFSALSSLFAGLMFFIMGIGNFNFEKGMIIYSVLFALSYASGLIFSILAITHGSLALTSLFISYSLIIPTFWGIIFLNEPIGKTLIWGILLLCISIALVNLKKSNIKNIASEEKTKFSFKWGLYVFLAFLGNGMCSTVQKLEQEAFNGAGKNEFMLLALGIVFVSMFLVSLRTEKEIIGPCVKSGFLLMALCGLSNGIVNLFVMILSNTMPASVMFPIISAGGIIATAIVSVFFYKEKLNIYQVAGLVLGVISVVLLNM